MSVTKDRRFAAKAGVIMLIALAMACTAFFITGEPAFAKAAKPGKIKTSTVKRVKATETGMTISFDKAKNATKYQVRYQKADAKNWRTVKSKKRTVTLNNLKKYTRYKVQVRGLNGKKAGAWTKAKTFTTLGDEHSLMFDPGENATLKEEERIRSVRAGEELGDFPMPELDVDGEKIPAWFATWFTEPFGKGKDVYEYTLMGDEDLVIYAQYKFDSNGDTDSDPVFHAEHQYFPGDLEIDGKDEVILKDVGVYGHLTITNTKKVTIDDVELQLGRLKVRGKSSNDRCTLIMKDVKAEQSFDLTNVNADEISNISSPWGKMEMWECNIGTLRNSTFKDWEEGGKGTLELKYTTIDLIDHCTIHSDRIAIYGAGNSGLFPDDMIGTIKDSYIYGRSTAIYLACTSYIRTIDNSVLISEKQECIRSDIGNTSPVGAFTGDTIIYSERGCGAFILSKNYSNSMVVDQGITGTVGKVRIYGAEGVDSGRHGAVNVPPGYHLENSNPAYSSLDNTRVLYDSDANFIGKKFYYLIKND